ncbi:hypothetical protein jhhlp_001998 [Lomentospora prolificans]|uniref:Ubiquinol-cytochrome c chaperone domain-containing protein n=1 Tax=Lomentospora prolificans TaxID=41688 RepID=A0A2N3NCU8_9PEZI|nr:hypothetical protein jhhlp_001998 [Lomentospora prolificans]
MWTNDTSQPTSTTTPTMACSRCSAQAGTLLQRASQQPVRIFSANARLARLPTVASAPRTIRTQARKESTQAGPAKTDISASKLAGALPTRKLDGTGLVGSYAIYGGTHQIYKKCSQPVTYSISEVDRHNGTVETLEDGEEVGKSEGTWHSLLGLPPTFSTWSQVTMLRMYVLVARARCLEAEAYNNWYHQLLNHFFFDCERMMDINHGLTAKSQRQRFLKDLFLQWRGLLASYDEGIAKGDAVLASAVWRNLYKGKEDVDFRTVAAVVSWMRATLWDLERVKDEDLVLGENLFRKSLESQFHVVDTQINATKD